ncbi:hypothetical protein Hte_007852 [Hypoxylon texense]
MTEPLAFNALRELYKSGSEGANTPLDQSERDKYLKELGRRPPQGPKRNASETKRIDNSHTKIRSAFINQTTDTLNDEQVMGILQADPETLKSLFALGKDQKSLLHKLVDFDGEKEEVDQKNFQKLQPLLRFLLVIVPDFPKWLDSNERVPLYKAIESYADAALKSQIVLFFCGKQNGHRGSDAAIESLGITGKNRGASLKPHALHKAIEENVEISEDILRSDLLKRSLGSLDGDGLSCLHRAICPPETDQRRKWVERLVNIDRNLLGVLNSDGVTPLQYLADQSPGQSAGSSTIDSSESTKQGKRPESSKKRGHSFTGAENRVVPQERAEGGEIETSLSPQNDNKGQEKELDLGTWLKIYCLTCGFGNSTARSIMYKPDKMLNTDFNSLETHDVVSLKFLSNLSKHFKLDNLLRIVFIPQVTVEWDRNRQTEDIRPADINDCVGRVDYFLIFWWLKHEARVSRVLRVVVEDMNLPNSMDFKTSHSDQAIVRCLEGLQVQVWNWKKWDISSDVIRQASPSVKEVYLYCSGTNAVLRSWSDSQGLVLLKNLETIHLKVDQGLESLDTMRRYVGDFESALSKRFRDEQRDIKIYSNINEHIPNLAESSGQLLRPKEEGEKGYEEQEWLKVMDSFADFVDEANIPDVKGQEVKVALIDDGVKSSLEGLDMSIDGGESYVESDPNEPQSPYLTSVKGHGTVMAYFIRRVCPKAINWAVRKGVDIISMSWTIDEIVETANKADKRVANLREAIRAATEDTSIKKRALLFCAWPDKGSAADNRTYPRSLSESIFAIGAGTREGNPSPTTGDSKPDFVLPGVELGIPIVTDKRRSGTLPPRYQKYTGSSVSCALAAGLAAMILYCTRKVKGCQADRLKDHKNMQAAFKEIGLSQDKWVRVTELFGKEIGKAKPSERREYLQLITDAFLGGINLQAKLHDMKQKEKAGVNGVRA